MPSKAYERGANARRRSLGIGGRRTLASIAKYVDHLEHRSGLVLDVGCGNGMAVGELMRRGTRAIGIDLVPQDWKSLPLVVGDGLDLPFRSEAFDVTGCFTVLEHLAEPARLLAEMARVLKPSGRIVIGCPNMRAVLMLRPGDFVTHRGGWRQRAKNFAIYSKLFLDHLALRKIDFEVFPEADLTKAPKKPADYDAVCAANFIAIKSAFRQLGIDTDCISAGMEYPASRMKRAALKIIDRIPILREMFGGMFITGIKRLG